MSNKSKTIGILAIQGDYERHQDQLKQVGVNSALVRLPVDLESIDALIIPGGESTTLNIMIDRFNMREPLYQFGCSNPLFGTCAGMIMMSQVIEDNQAEVTPLKLMDIDVVRTGYGRQVHSFEIELEANLGGENMKIPATFIRAPIITRFGPKVKVLAEYGSSPVLIEEGRHLAASFHPELSINSTIMIYFISKI